jgi:hypothetical protein
VLKERPLTVTETTQVAKSVLAAISALHASGLVHEHIEPSNILAVGEVVKLRSDCVRECIPDGTEFNTPEGCAELRRRDIHGFGVLMLRCLTLERQLTRNMRLPAPYDRVIPGAIEGAWTLEQIQAVLDPMSFAPRPAATAASPAARPTPPAETAVAGAPSRPAAAPPAQPQRATPSAAVPQQRSLDLQPDAKPEPSIGVRTHHGLADEPAPFSLKPIWILCGASALLVVLFLGYLFSGKPASPTAPTQVQSATPASAVAHHPARQMATVPVAAPHVAPVIPTPAPAAHAAGWYVIAYTYNHPAQAQAKADRLNTGRRGLHADVFSPRGGAPYLVSLGGPMSQSEAKALQTRARRSGLPRDTYIRNYK